MCISFHASLIAGTIGEISGIVAMNRGHIELGSWIMTYSLIQFLEAWAYTGEGQQASKLLKPLLYGQGMILFGTSMRIRPFLCGVMLTLTGLLYALDKSDKLITCNKRCKWKSSGGSYVKIMYGLMFILGALVQPRVTTVFAGTLLTSYLFRETEGYPSMWCFSSALVAPIAVAVVQKNRSFVMQKSK